MDSGKHADRRGARAMGRDSRRTTGQSWCFTAKAWVRWRARRAFGYLPDISRMGFDSVLWVGPPNASPLWRALIRAS